MTSLSADTPSSDRYGWRDVDVTRHFPGGLILRQPNQQWQPSFERPRSITVARGETEKSRDLRRVLPERTMVAIHDHERPIEQTRLPQSVDEGPERAVEVVYRLQIATHRRPLQCPDVELPVFLRELIWKVIRQRDEEGHERLAGRAESVIDLLEEHFVGQTHFERFPHP